MSEHSLFALNVLSHLVALMSGIVSFGLALWAEIKKKPHHSLVFWIIGGLCLIIAFDQSWRDEHRNTQSVVEQKSELSAKLTACSIDLRAATDKATFFEEQTHTQQQTINGLQQTMAGQQQTANSQQTAMNSCVVALGQKAVGEPVNVSVWQEEIPNDPKGPKLTGIVLLVNRTVTLRGDLECPAPFGLAHWGMMKKPISGGIETDYRAEVLAPNRIHINLGLPPWEPGMPVLLMLTHKDDIGTCSFTLQRSR